MLDDRADPETPRRNPAAMLSHSRIQDRDRFVGLARQHGVAVEFLPWSWYAADHTAALFIRM
jgi:hypothetical protein